jgi:hypothetical protein
MTDDNTTQQTAGGIPDAAEPVLTPRKRMSADDPKAVEQAIARKFRIRELEAKVQELESKIGTLTKERDDAVTAAEETNAAWTKSSSRWLMYFVPPPVLALIVSITMSRIAFRKAMACSDSVNNIARFRNALKSKTPRTVVFVT